MNKLEAADILFVRKACEMVSEKMNIASIDVTERPEGEGFFYVVCSVKNVLMRVALDPPYLQVDFEDKLGFYYNQIFTKLFQQWSYVLLKEDALPFSEDDPYRINPMTLGDGYKVRYQGLIKEEY
jgi:hypothetical protein